MDASNAVATEDSSHSCDFCKGIVQQLIQPTVESVGRRPPLFSLVKPIQVGWLDSIMKNQLCSLCRFITRIHDAIKLPADQSVSGQRRLYCHISGQQIRLTKSGKRRDWNLLFMFGSPEDGNDERMDSLYEPVCRLYSGDAHLLGLHENIYNLGLTTNPDKYDLQLIKSYYDECRQLHGAKCEYPSRTIVGKRVTLWTRMSLPSAMRFVDVQDNCVKPVWPQPDYVALSYMWGGVDMIKLTKANLRGMEMPGSLLNVNLPRTIRDAISVTRALGERYIWIDAVCICQDDMDTKMDQIQQMDKIYSNATLTIIAAGADHADAGLPCFRTGSRRHAQVIESIQGLRFVSVAPDIEKVLSMCTYSSRGWTFQEYVLSKRLLVFTPFQVYYSCGVNTCSEDFLYRLAPEGDDSTDGTSNDDAEGQGDLDGRALHFEQNFPSSYESVVSQYSQRRLTYEADVIPAVLGILNLMSTTLNETFICGIPKSCIFEHGLLWLPSDHRMRRRESSSPEGSTLFPSWSWIGWVGPVRYVIGALLGEDQRAIDDAREIGSWSARLPQGKHRRTRFECSNAGQGGSSCGNPDDDHVAYAQEGILCFATDSVELRIDHQPFGRLAILASSSLDPDSTCFKICHEDKWIGCVLLEKHVAKGLQSADGALCEFIVLSRVVDSVKIWAISLPQESVDYTPNYYTDFCPAWDEEFDGGADGTVYNVMLIERRGGLAYRVALGQVHKTGWDLAGPVRKEVELG